MNQIFSPKKNTKKSTAIPKTLREVSNEVHRSRITKKNYKGKVNHPQAGLVEKWESRGVEYLINASVMGSLRLTHPRVYTDQKKNLYQLVKYVHQQRKENGGKATAEFTLGKYLKDRGYSDSQIHKGGSLYKNVTQLIECGAHVRYGRVEQSKDGKQGRQVIGSFYNIIKEGTIDAEGNIGGKGTVYKVMFNAPYAQYIEQGQDQFFLIPEKMISDQYLDANPVAFNFIDHLVFLQGMQMYPTRIDNLLRGIGVLEKYLDSEPGKCFNYLRDCLVHAAVHYPGHIKGLTIHNSDRSKRQHLKLPLIPKMKNWGYGDFKVAALEMMGETDLRRCYIVFEGAPKKLLLKKAGTEALIKPGHRPLIEDIMYWVTNSVDFSRLDKITPEGTRLFLQDAIQELSPEVVYRAFTKARSADRPNPFVFITKTLPGLIRGFERKGETTSIKGLLREKGNK